MLEKQRDSLMGRRAMFQNGIGVAGKNPEKAGNSGDAACFIMKPAG
jgi:hypothetical protein